MAEFNPWSIGGALLGGLLGGQDSKTQTQQQSQPWAPAQPWIQSNIASGQNLQRSYQQQPFSPMQLGAFGNSFGLTDNFRNNASSLVNQMGSQKTFDRSNPEAKPTMFNFTGGTSSPNSFGGFMPQQAPNAAFSPASSPVNPYMPQQGGPANGSRGYEQDKGDGWGGGYGVDRSSPLGGSVGDTGNMFGNAVMGLHNYGNLGFAPGSMFAKIAADMLNDKATQATAVSARDALASQIAADRTFGGGGFGGIGGMTSPTGAGIAANPMGRDPAQAMGEFYGGYFGGGRDPNSAG